MRGPARKRKGGAAMALVAALTLVAAMPGPASADEGEAWDAERAFVEMERLQAEIGMLRALAGAQAALLAWNRARAESGGGLAVLPAALCVEPEIELWCRTLPESFGRDAGDAGAEADREGMER